MCAARPRHRTDQKPDHREPWRGHGQHRSHYTAYERRSKVRGHQDTGDHGNAQVLIYNKLHYSLLVFFLYRKSSSSILLFILLLGAILLSRKKSWVLHNMCRKWVNTSWYERIYGIDNFALFCIKPSYCVMYILSSAIKDWCIIGWGGGCL